MRQHLFELWKLATSEQGGWIVGRSISFLGHIVAMLIVMVMTFRDAMTVELFFVYVSFVAGHASVAKHMDNKWDAKRLEIKEDAEIKKLELTEAK